MHIEREVQRQNFKALLTDCKGSINILTAFKTKKRKWHELNQTIPITEVKKEFEEWLK